MKICHLVGAGDFDEVSFHPAQGDFVIACDGGLTHLRRCGVTPDLTVGDFDSLGRVPEGQNVTVLPVEKDDTDMLYAAKRGLAEGYSSFILHGSLGGSRPSHSLANIALLSFLVGKGARGVLVSQGILMTVLENETLTVRHGEGEISLFAYGGSCSVTLSGMKYPFVGEFLPSMPLGVSNRLEGCARICVGSGQLLAVYEGNDLSAEDFLNKS